MTYAITPPPQRQRGITLIESLIAIVITALGILGILGVQMRTLSDTSTTVRRAQAIRLIEDLSERLRANPNAVAMIDNYVTTFTDTPPPPPDTTCSAGCDPAPLAIYDRDNWKNAVSGTMPNGKAALFLPPADTDLGLVTSQRRQLGVMIAWRENERHDADTGYKDNIDASKINDGGTFKDGGGAAATCPAGHTCHLQYIPVSGRCAPDDNFPGQYFCAGPQK